MSTAPDPRWVVLLENGSYNLLGRTAPTEAEVGRAETAMTASGMRGWLTIMDRSEFAPGKPIFSMVREMGKPDTEFEDAVGRFSQIRVAKTR